jgi:hypothetical protein
MSSRSKARLAGLLYLVVAVTGGFAQLVARGGVLVRGDASATAENIRANAGLLQLGFAADAVNIVAFVLLALLLHAVLSPTSPALSRTFVTLVAIASAIMGLDLANHAAALVVATDPSFAASMGADAADSIAALFLNVHQYGYLAAEVFFGLWLVPLGVAIYRSGAFPRWLGIGLVVGGVAYLGSFAVTAASPRFEAEAATIVALPAAIAELSLVLWLLIRGADVSARADVATPSAQPTLTAEVAR